jgi:hypothetical protein
VTDAARARSALDAALATLESRGLRLRRGSGPVAGRPEPERLGPPISTGQPVLDAVLGGAGWPRGSLASLDAPPGCGATSIALGTLSACQATDGLVAWIDGQASFDPAGAARRGIDLRWLLLARPRDPAEAVELAAWLCRAGLLDLLVLDLGTATGGGQLLRQLERLAGLVARSSSVVLLIGAAAARAPAAVQVQLERRAWLAVGRDLVGQRVEARVRRARGVAAGRSAALDVWFAEGRRIDPLLPAVAEPRVEPPALDAERPAARVLSA